MEFSSVQPTQKAPLRDTFDNCTMIFFFDWHVTNIRKNIPHLSLINPKNRQGPLSLIGTTCCKLLPTALMPNMSNIGDFWFYVVVFLFNNKKAIFSASNYLSLKDTMLQKWGKVTALQVPSKSQVLAMRSQVTWLIQVIMFCLQNVKFVLYRVTISIVNLQK